MDGSAWIERRRDETPHGNPLARFLEVVSLWSERVQQRRSLAELSDRDLRDIGISRVEQRGECAKPFWRP